MNSYLEKIYYSSPVWVQNFMVSAYGARLYYERYAGSHDRYLKELIKSQWLDKTRMASLIDEKYCSMLAHAVDTVPFYQELFKKKKYKMEDFKSISSIRKLPIITKEMIRTDPGKFISKAYKKNKLLQINTSGTSGKTLNIFVDVDSRRYSYAFFSRFKYWLGFGRNTQSVTFAGRVIKMPDDNAEPFYRKNTFFNNYLFSSYHLNRDNLFYYVKELQEINPPLIDSYPSSIYAITKYMSDHNIKGITPKAVITSSETLLESQREIIEGTLGCKVYDQYGSAEQVVFISQCEMGTYHIHPEYGYVEFLNDDYMAADNGQLAQLICTGFTNKAMPLFRYEIGDTGILSNKKCQCGREFPVVDKIIGRTDDILLTPDGRRVGRLDPVFKGLSSIKEAQIIQSDLNTIELKIVPSKYYQQCDGEVVKKELKKRLGDKVDVRIVLVDEIERTKSGKFRAVISRVNGRQ